jgi:hypothetical protein
LFIKTLGFNSFKEFAFGKESISKLKKPWHFESQMTVGWKQIYGLDEIEDDFDPQRCVTVIHHDCPGNQVQLNAVYLEQWKDLN